jgi:hypothetical protein
MSDTDGSSLTEFCRDRSIPIEKANRLLAVYRDRSQIFYPGLDTDLELRSFMEFLDAGVRSFEVFGEKSPDLSGDSFPTFLLGVEYLRGVSVFLRELPGRVEFDGKTLLPDRGQTDWRFQNLNNKDPPPKVC